MSPSSTQKRRSWSIAHVPTRTETRVSHSSLVGSPSTASWPTPGRRPPRRTAGSRPRSTSAGTPGAVGGRRGGRHDPSATRWAPPQDDRDRASACRFRTFGPPRRPVFPAHRSRGRHPSPGATGRPSRNLDTSLRLIPGRAAGSLVAFWQEGRHAPASSRRTPLMIAGAVALLVVLGSAPWCSATGAVATSSPGTTPVQPPTFAFEVVEADGPDDRADRPRGTVNEAKAQGRGRARGRAGRDRDARPLRRGLPRARELDRGATTRAVDEFFADAGAGRRGRSRRRSLRPAKASPTLDSIVPRSSTLKLKVLLDALGKPSSVVGDRELHGQGHGRRLRSTCSRARASTCSASSTVSGRSCSFSVQRADTEKAPARARAHRPPGRAS